MASRTKAKINNINDRALEVGQTDEISLDDMRALKTFYDFTCLKCGAKPAISPDHVIPLADGGTNTVENLQLLCERCNKAKRAKSHDYRNGKILTREIADELISQQKPQRKYKKHDWDEIEFEFVTSDTEVSLRELANKFGVSLSHIGSVSTSEQWIQKRENFRNKLGTSVQAQAAQEQIDYRLEITRTTLDFLKLWRRQSNEISNQDLIKVLELGARAYGLELSKSTLTVKDWRDATSDDTTNIQEFATGAAETYFSASDSGSDRDAGSGWTD